MKARKFALVAAFVFAGTAAFAEVTPETRAVIDNFLGTQQFDRAEVRVGLNQIKVEMISNGQKVEVILDKADGTELKRETEAAGLFDGNTPGVFIRERNRDFLRSESDDDSNDDDEDEDEDGDDDSSDDDSSDDDSDDNSGGSDDSDDDSNDDNGGDRNGSDDSDDDSNDDNGGDRNGSDDSNDDNSGSDDNGGDDSNDD